VHSLADLMFGCIQLLRNNKVGITEDVLFIRNVKNYTVNSKYSCTPHGTNTNYMTYNTPLTEEESTYPAAEHRVQYQNDRKLFQEIASDCKRSQTAISHSQ